MVPLIKTLDASFSSSKEARQSQLCKKDRCLNLLRNFHVSSFGFNFFITLVNLLPIGNYSSQEIVVKFLPPNHNNCVNENCSFMIMYCVSITAMCLIFFQEQ